MMLLATHGPLTVQPIVARHGAAKRGKEASATRTYEVGIQTTLAVGVRTLISSKKLASVIDFSSATP